MDTIINKIYIKKIDKMDEFKFKNTDAKVYYYILKNLNENITSNNNFFNEYRKNKIEVEKYRNECSVKPDRYKTKNNKVPDDIIEEYDSFNLNYQNAIDILDNLVDSSNVKISQILNSSELKNIKKIANYNISGIDKLIRDLDDKIIIKRTQIAEKNLKNTKSNKINNTLDEFAENVYKKDKFEENELEANSLEFLSKKQKELEIYEYLSYILYFILTSSLGFYYLYKNK